MANTILGMGPQSNAMQGGIFGRRPQQTALQKFRSASVPLGDQSHVPPSPSVTPGTGIPKLSSTPGFNYSPENLQPGTGSAHPGNDTPFGRAVSAYMAKSSGNSALYDKFFGQKAAARNSLHQQNMGVYGSMGAGADHAPQPGSVGPQGGYANSLRTGSTFDQMRQNYLRSQANPFNSAWLKNGGGGYGGNSQSIAGFQPGPSVPPQYAPGSSVPSLSGQGTIVSRENPRGGVALSMAPSSGAPTFTPQMRDAQIARGQAENAGLRQKSQDSSFVKYAFQHGLEAAKMRYPDVAGRHAESQFQTEMGQQRQRTLAELERGILERHFTSPDAKIKEKLDFLKSLMQGGQPTAQTPGAKPSVPRYLERNGAARPKAEAADGASNDTLLKRIFSLIPMMPFGLTK